MSMTARKPTTQRHYKRTVLELLLALSFCGLCETCTAQDLGLIRSYAALPEPKLAKPAVGAPFRDPVFNSTIVRLTDAVAKKSAGYICYYPKLNPFNAGETKILIYERGGRWQLYARTGEYLGVLPIKKTQTDPQPRWHPHDPNLLLWFDANKIVQYDLATRKLAVLATFAEYDFVTNFDEGNFSKDARFVALAGKKWPWVGGLQEFFTYDLSEKKTLGEKIIATGKEVDWITISPSGKYLVVLVGSPHGEGQWQGVDVYQLPEMKYLAREYYPFSDHADLGFDSEGNEVYVTDNAEATFPDRQRHLEAYRLDNGKKTDLLGFAWGLSRLISCQNYDAPGWAIVSTYSKPEHYAENKAHPFDDEIFAVKLDGSHEVRRIAHHRSQRFSVGDYAYNNYWDQPNAVPSRSGKYILFSSNWRELGAPQDVYLIDLSAQAGWIVP